jgi:hypothetical protein
LIDGDAVGTLARDEQFGGREQGLAIADQPSVSALCWAWLARSFSWCFVRIMTKVFNIGLDRHCYTL